MYYFLTHTQYRNNLKILVKGLFQNDNNRTRSTIHYIILFKVIKHTGTK
jgi:hypothetical protein